MWKRGSIEAGGTFMMVFVGCGSVAVERSHLEISLAFGGIVALVILAIGRWSGAHINPAVSIAFRFVGNVHDLAWAGLDQLDEIHQGSILWGLRFSSHSC